MGLGKEKGSSRINRYEHQVTAIGFENLEKLAEVLDVPVAYLLAENASMADAILALANVNQRQQANLATVLKGLSEDPGLVKALLKLLQLPEAELAATREALFALAGDGGAA